MSDLQQAVNQLRRANPDGDGQSDVVYTIQKPDRFGKRLVVASRNGQEWRGTIDPYNDYQVEQFAESVYGKLFDETEQLDDWTPSGGANRRPIEHIKDAITTLAIAEDQKAEGGEHKKPRFEIISSNGLDNANYTPTPIITEALFAGVPAIIGAPFKTCKSLVGIDAAISIATGLPFLGSFTVPAPMSVVYFSGEGGPCVAQEYGRRIAASKGIALSDATQLNWCFSVPRLESLDDLDAFAKVLDDTGAEIPVIDNLMLAMSGDDAGNVFKMGAILGNVIRICSERHVTPVFIHHFKRSRATADPFAPGELSDLTQAGAAEIAGQWWLLTRRESYNPESPGQHRLWLSVGGRVGHSSLHALDIEEGSRIDVEGRRWDVKVRNPSEVRDEQERSHEDARRTKQQAKRQAEMDADRKEIVAASVKIGGPETKNELRARVSCGHRRFDVAFASLVNDGTLQSATVTKTNGQDYDGWRVRNEQE